MKHHQGLTYNTEKQHEMEGEMIKLPGFVRNTYKENGI